MKRFTLILSLLVAMVTTAMAQKAHQRVSHDGWVVTALNEAGTSGNEGGVAFIADDNASTFYHSNWSSNYTDGNGVNKGKDGLQAFMVELPTSLSDLSLITYKGRSDNNGSGWARGVRVYVFETLPTGWPAGGLSSLGYVDKQALLASTNANLGTAAFDNTAKQWANDRTQKLVEFATPQTGKYVLFIMESGSDAWLTCSDFQIYQLKDYAAIEAETPYFLQVTNAAVAGSQYVDIKTPFTSTSANTIGISTTTVEAYFEWNTTANAWNIKDDAGTYLAVSRWDANPGQATAGNWQLFVNDDNTLSIFQGDYDGATDNSRCFLGGDVTTDASVTKLYTDNAKDKAINVTLIDANAVPVTVKYSFTWNGVEKGVQTTETFGGELYPDVDFELPFGVAATKPSGEIDATEAEEVEGVKTITKTIVLENTLPFVYADSYANINNWYYLQFHASVKNYLYYGGTADVLDASKTAVDATQIDNYTWGFIGDPFTGFTVVNYGAGEGKALNAGESGAIVGDEAQVMTLTASPHGENGFYMQNLSGDYTQRFNRQNGQVVYWSNADAGSTFMVIERDITGLADLQALIDQVDAAIAAYGQGGTTVGYYTAESTAALATALAAAKTAAEANTSAAANAAAQTALQNAVAALEIIMPEEGKFYRIVSHCIKDHRANQEVYVSKDGDMHFGKVADNVAAGTIGHIFQFVPANDGKFYIYNVQRGVYMQAVGGQGTPAVVTTDVNKAKPVAIKHLGVDNVIGIYPDGQNMMHAQDANSKIVGWNSTDVTDASAWVITEVANITELYQEVAMSEVGYATLCLGYNATIPAGVEAYAVSSTNSTHAIMTQINGAIPANEAVILKLAEDASAGTFNFVYAESADDVENNLLMGTTVDANMTEDAYVLGIVDEKVGLYTAAKNVNTDTTNDSPEVTYEAWLNNANKAYLPAPANAQGIKSYSFRFGEGTTGIDEITDNREQSTVIYDLTGRRIEAITAPGIYVVNGKKVLVK